MVAVIWGKDDVGESEVGRLSNSRDIHKTKTGLGPFNVDPQHLCPHLRLPADNSYMHSSLHLCLGVF